MSRKRPRSLSPEEAALWDHVAGTTRPIHPKRKQAEPSKPVTPMPVPKSPPALPMFKIGEAAAPRRMANLIQPGLSERLSGEPVRMDRKAFTKMARGKLRPEGKIDLHGMTLSEAHPRLTAFVLRAQAEGKRLILVVTGKGRDRDDGGPIPAPRGALKHQVPIWLAQAPLSAIVLQLKEAHRSHGGTGAYYVYLRRAA
jgi:DNA-nicking Smr family endonuclease